MLHLKLLSLGLVLCSLFWDLRASEVQSSSHTMDIIRARGFRGEEYHIKSFDGYPLTAYHVVNPLADQRSLNKFPVIIFHGLGGDATQMISHSVESRARKPIIGQLTAIRGDYCLPFMLSNNNYDVWLIDSRGVNLNNRNISVDTNLLRSQQFWKYSLDEQSLNDAPRLIDFVLEQTGAPKALVVTYSESTFFLFALLSAAPEYANKVASLVAMAPTVYVSHLQGLAVPWMVPFMLTPDIVDGNFAPQPFIDTLGMTIRRLCSIRLVATIVCQQASQAIAGRQQSSSNGADFFTTLAQSSAIRVFKHFVQLNQAKRFGMYDYGPQVNLIKYGQAIAPNYDLGRIRLPTIVLFRGGNDFLSTEPDQERLIAELGVKPLLDIRLPNYNHLDFILNDNVTNDVNIPIAHVFAQVMLNDANSFGILTRDMFSSILLRTQRPDKTVEPKEEFGRIINSEVHTFRNLADALDLKSKLGLLIPSTQTGHLSKGLYKLVENVDRLASTVNGIPDIVQAHIPI